MSKCPWFGEYEQELSDKLPLHVIDDDKYNKVFFNSIKCHKSNTTSFTTFDYGIKSDTSALTTVYDLDKLQQKFNEKLAELQNKITLTNAKTCVESLKEAEIKKINIQIKTLTTKYNKQVDNMEKIVKSRTFGIKFSKEQKEIINSWIIECDKVYNYCVDLYNLDSSNFNLNYKVSKLEVFAALYGDKPKGCPYDTLTDEVRSFCSNVKSCLSNLANKNITHYKMTYKNNYHGRSIMIPTAAITTNGIFPSLLGKMTMPFNANDVITDSRLILDNSTQMYYLKCPMYFNKSTILNRMPLCALDPGEKVFMTGYSPNESIVIGKDIRYKILYQQSIIRRIQKALADNKNRQNNTLKNKKKLKRQIQYRFTKIKNIVKELHNKTALHLVKSYDRILIPSFETQNMVSDKVNNIKARNAHIKLRIQEFKNMENPKKEIRNYTKKCRLNRKVKFVLLQLSHYKFRQHLLHKAVEYGCSVDIVTEEYTSQCCGKCGMLSKYYKARTKHCSFCKFEIDRDINGSRNIFIKHVQSHNIFVKPLVVMPAATT